MIRNQVTKLYVRFNGAHYKKLVRKQSEPGSPKYFLKKDIARCSKAGKSIRTRTGGSFMADTCDVCFDEVNVVDLIELDCRGKHRVCASCIKRWCTEKLPFDCTCPFCRDPIRSHRALEQYMTTDMIALYRAEQTPINRAKFVFESVAIKLKTFDALSANDFARMSDDELNGYRELLDQCLDHVENHIDVVRFQGDNRENRYVLRMGEKLLVETACGMSYTDFVARVRRLSNLGTSQRATIDQLIDTHFNIRNYRTTRSPTDRSVPRPHSYTVTIRGDFVVWDDVSTFNHYLTIEPHALSLTHRFRVAWLKYALYKLFSDALASWCTISQAIDVRSEVDYRFMTDPKCRAYSKFESHTRKPIEVTVRLSAATRVDEEAFGDRKGINDINKSPVLKLGTWLGGYPHGLNPNERIPWIYKFHVKHMSMR